MPADEIISAGWSLGAAVAIDLAALRPVGGLVALSPFTSIRDMAKRLTPFELGGLFPWSDRFDSLNKISMSTCPILIAHGVRDVLVPFDMAVRLRDAAKHPGRSVDFVAVESAGHDDLLSIANRSLVDPLVEFFKKLTSSSRA